MGCNSAKKSIEPTAKTKALDALVSQKNFTMQADWAYPLVTSSLTSIANSRLLPPGSMVNSISLIGNVNHLRVYGDSISIDLPYYGERQIAGGYNTRRGGIVWKGIPDDFEVIKNEKKQRHLIKFSVNDIQESYRVIITLYPNWQSDVNITSSHRTAIRYKGAISRKDKYTSLDTP